MPTPTQVGPTHGALSINITGPGNGWTNPTRVQNAPDGLDASCALNFLQSSDVLAVYFAMFGPGTVPANGAVVGVEVRAHDCHYTGVSAPKFQARLYDGSPPSASNDIGNLGANQSLPASDGDLVWGGDSDLWGLDPSVLKLWANSTNAGCGVKLVSGNNNVGLIDSLSMTLWYITLETATPIRSLSAVQGMGGRERGSLPRWPDA